MEQQVNRIATQIAQIPPDGFLHKKICMNTSLKMRILDALFQYYDQMNRLSRFVFRK